MCEVEGKPLLRGEFYERLGLRLGGLSFSTVLMEKRSKVQGKSEAKGMRQLSGETQRLSASL
jgi:hypothetical protein